MKLAALTQRVAIDPRHGERRDALDQRWIALLADAGYRVVALPNGLAEGAEALLARLAPDLIILTGGNSLAAVAPGAADAAPERDAYERALIDAALKHAIPLAGVCRGMQALNLHLGGTLRPVAGHVAVRHALRGDGVPGDVNSYHDWGIAPPDLAPDLRATAFDPDGNVEALQHASFAVTGIMWHPEREQPFRRQDLAWLGIA